MQGHRRRQVPGVLGQDAEGTQDGLRGGGQGCHLPSKVKKKDEYFKSRLYLFSLPRLNGANQKKGVKIKCEIL